MSSPLWTLYKVLKGYFVPSLLHDLTFTKSESIKKVTAACNSHVQSGI